MLTSRKAIAAYGISTCGLLQPTWTTVPPSSTAYGRCQPLEMSACREETHINRALNTCLRPRALEHDLRRTPLAHRLPDLVRHLVPRPVQLDLQRVEPESPRLLQPTLLQIRDYQRGRACRTHAQRCRQTDGPRPCYEDRLPDARVALVDGGESDGEGLDEGSLRVCHVVGDGEEVLGGVRHVAAEGAVGGWSGSELDFRTELKHFVFRGGDQAKYGATHIVTTTDAVLACCAGYAGLDRDTLTGLDGGDIGADSGYLARALMTEDHILTNDHVADAS